MPFRALTPYNAGEVFVPNDTPYNDVSIQFAPSRERLQGDVWKSGPRIGERKWAETQTAYTAFVKAERRAYIDAHQTQQEYEDELANKNDDSRDQFDFKHAGLKGLHDDAEEEAKEQYELNPDVTYESTTGSRDQSFIRALPPLAQRLMTTIAKCLTIINNIKIIYKSKISGNKLNRFNQTDMIKIQALFDKFIGICKDIVEKMNNQRRVILDRTLLKKLYLNVDFSNLGTAEDRRLTDEVARLEIPFRHAYDKAEQKFIKQINEIDALYIADKERYSFNRGKF